MKFRVVVDETIVVAKTYLVEAEDETEAWEKAAAGETEREHLIETEGVSHREVVSVEPYEETEELALNYGRTDYGNRN